MLKKRFLVIFLILFNVSFSFASLYKTNVTVSYYAEDFHGKKTSSGEIFNMYDLTCAHLSLPFGTVLKITNRANGKSVNVRVNDRGPFVLNREVDLSKAAAVKLDMIKSGTTKVDIEIVKSVSHSKQSLQTAQKAQKMMKNTYPAAYASSSTNTSAASKTSSFDYSKLISGTLWDIQVASFSSYDNAKNFAQQLYDKGFSDIVFQKTDEVTRVVIKAVEWNKVQNMEKQLKEKGYTSLVIRERK
ncbi:MAG: septal ring lytic transglycosylase RlpA family protein [Treponema sp.]|nr:septal ring lytic transglycosylase RlpA family protein [Treponema sp.]